MIYSSEELSGAEDAQTPSADFAGLMAKMNSSGRSARSWLAEDAAPTMLDEIIPLSYEQALKKHARRPSVEHTAEKIDRVASLLAENLAERRNHSTVHTEQSPANELAEGFATREIDRDSKEFEQDTLSLNRASAQTAKATETKAASITLRMSEQEAIQVRKRAADAGLTISAYIRSCVCEAELLRAQVKSALIEIRQVNSRKEESAPGNVNRPWWNRLAARG
jgi:predicted DNA binding CopG/RHH family protein